MAASPPGSEIIMMLNTGFIIVRGILCIISGVIDNSIIVDSVIVDSMIIGSAFVGRIIIAEYIIAKLKRQLQL